MIYKQAPRPETPPPLVIRERPPSPLNHPREPLIIERRIAAPTQSQPRKIIIENLPAPPPKPRDIILEKWLPTKDSTPQRPVYYQKAYKSMTQSQLFSNQKPVYEIVDQRVSTRDQHQHVSHYEYLDPSQSNKKLYKQIASKQTDHSEMIYGPVTGAPLYSSPSQSMHQAFAQPSEIYYTPNPNRKSKVAGYRIIRQIIPGPNSTPADIEKALARSQRISTVYPNQRKNYSPSFELNNSFQYPIYSASGSQNNYEYFYSPSKSSSKHVGNTNMVNTAMHSTYVPHNIYTKNDIYRSSSIDNF